MGDVKPSVCNSWDDIRFLSHLLTNSEKNETLNCETSLRDCLRVVYLSPADKYHRLTRRLSQRAKRPKRESSHGLSAALSPLVTPSKQAVRTHVACQATFPCRFPPPWLAHTPAGWGHGGTRNRSTSRSVQTRSVSPAAMAGVRGCHWHCQVVDHAS